MPDPIASSRPGMGAVPYPGGVTFRVWAPHADALAVTGSFDGWTAAGRPMARDGQTHRSVDVPDAKPGDEYRFLVRTRDQERSRLDPRARQLTAMRQTRPRTAGRSGGDMACR